VCVFVCVCVYCNFAELMYERENACICMCMCVYFYACQEGNGQRKKKSWERKAPALYSTNTLTYTQAHFEALAGVSSAV
jgi:hypothetical protein